MISIRRQDYSQTKQVKEVIKKDIQYAHISKIEEKYQSAQVIREQKVRARMKKSIELEGRLNSSQSNFQMKFSKIEQKAVEKEKKIAHLEQMEADLLNKIKDT
jgi:hypothetical protein